MMRSESCLQDMGLIWIGPQKINLVGPLLDASVQFIEKKIEEMMIYFPNVGGYKRAHWSSRTLRCQSFSISGASKAAPSFAVRQEHPPRISRPIWTPESFGVRVLMEDTLGLLRIHVHRGINLAVRDLRSSDPYVVVRMGKQVLIFVFFSSSFWSPVSVISLFWVLFGLWGCWSFGC